MKAKTLCDAGEIKAGTDVEIVTSAGANDDRGPEDVGGQSTKAAPVYAVKDTDGHEEEVDTRDLQVVP